MRMLILLLASLMLFTAGRIQMVLGVGMNSLMGVN